MICSRFRNGFLIFICLLIWSERSFAQPTLYKLVDEASYLHIYTGAEGWLRSFSHDHQVSVRGFEGEILWDGLNSSANLIFYPEAFLVDDDYERSLAIDTDFHEPVSESIQSGTRQNMLGDRVLAADTYNEITVDISLVSFAETEALAEFSVQFRGQDFLFQKPISLFVADNVLQAEADFELSHSDLGLRPYSVGAGLARVAEMLRFHVFIEGRRANQ